MFCFVVVVAAVVVVVIPLQMHLIAVDLRENSYVNFLLISIWVELLFYFEF